MKIYSGEDEIHVSIMVFPAYLVGTIINKSTVDIKYLKIFSNVNPKVAIRIFNPEITLPQIPTGTQASFTMCYIAEQSQIPIELFFLVFQQEEELHPNLSIVQRDVILCQTHDQIIYQYKTWKPYLQSYEEEKTQINLKSLTTPSQTLELSPKEMPFYLHNFPYIPLSSLNPPQKSVNQTFGFIHPNSPFTLIIYHYPYIDIYSKDHLKIKAQLEEYFLKTPQNREKICFDLGQKITTLQNYIEIEWELPAIIKLCHKIQQLTKMLGIQYSMKSLIEQFHLEIPINQMKSEEISQIYGEIEKLTSLFG